ncbi:MAG: hypothetical protein IT529_03370 [Burkholderiales bacterium]|nr:hypothetical protein [Burkholderiales bacterium]
MPVNSAASCSSSNERMVSAGTRCHHQIADGAQGEGLHVARVLQRALA